MCRNRKIEKGSKLALVTGASTGIGRQYSEQLAELGYNLVIVSRTEEALFKAKEEIEAKHGIMVVVKAMDLAVDGAAEELFAWCKSEGYVVDVLINNAGMFSFCDVLNTSVERLERIILLHDLTLTTMCRLYGEDMVRRGKGRLLNMSSYSIWMPFPGLAAYSASKAYVKSFTQAFAKELRKTGVTVTAICPAGIATDLYGLSKGLQKFGVKWGVLMSPKSCARRGLKAMFKGRSVVVPDWWFRLLIPFCKYLPGFIIRPLRRFTMKWQK